MTDPVGAASRLEAQLATVDRRRDPVRHAALAYRIGLAHAESPSGPPMQNLQRALNWYQTALAGFDARFEPVARARALNGAAAAARALGQTVRAAGLFGDAADLLRDRDRPDERAAALNNLGLTRTDLGDVAGAVQAFDEAIELFSPGTADGRRGRAAGMVNRGMTQASLGTAVSLTEAVTGYRTAIALVADDEASYHRALAEHCSGVAEMALASLDDEHLDDHLTRATAAFEASLQFFSRTGFPYQHSLAKHNLGRSRLASATRCASGDGRHRRLLTALVAVEDAVAVLDPRLHTSEWRQAHGTLEEIEAALAAVGRRRTRLEHFVALFAVSSPEERTSLVTNRLTRLLSLPAQARHVALRDLASACTAQPDVALDYIGTELTVLTELPNEHLEAALEARLDAHRTMPEDRRLVADAALDQAVGDALNGPQRVFVRDYLSERGFERP